MPQRNPRRVDRTRVVAAVAAAAVPVALLAAGAPRAAAQDGGGSAYPLFLERGSRTGDPANAVTVGRWGHEGPSHDQGTFVSADTRDGGTALRNAFGGADTSDLAVAFAPTSPDGSTERPQITAGENIGQAYAWFTGVGFGAGLTGTPGDPATDSVLTVSTLGEYQDWLEDGSPAQAASSDDLVMHDVQRAGDPVSAHPMGRSILDRWPAGESISLVVVRTTGSTDPATGLPVVADDGTGHAEAAWITFTTQADPAVGDASHSGVATSGGYDFRPAGAGAGGSGAATTGGSATTTAVAVNPGTGAAYADVLLSATVSPVIAGTVQFLDGATGIGDPAAVDGSGVATLTTRALGPGDHTITAVFTPADSTTYAGSSATSPSFTLDGTASGQGSDGTVTADVPPGELLVSTPYGPDNPLDLGRLRLTADARMYTGQTLLDQLVVTDTRAGALPWTLDALAGDLSTSSGALIDGQDIGLVGLTPVSATGSGVVTAYDVPPADPPVAPGTPGSLGLGRVFKQILHSTAGPGSVTYRGTLRVNAPTTTRAGHYTGTLTLTVS